MADFKKMNRLGEVSDALTAIRSFYKPDRIPDDFSRQAASANETDKWLRSEGEAILASRHESRTGRALWVRWENGKLAVYESSK